jgi:ribonuclease J
MEGTHFGSERTQSRNEYQLEEELVELIRSAPALVLASFSPIDVDRLVSYYKAVRRAGRIFVVDAYAAFVLCLISRDAWVPEPKREFGIRVLFNKAFRNRKHQSMEERFAGEQITLDEILAEPSKHAMVFRPSMTEMDFEGQLPEQSRCLYSYWKGYLAKPDWVELQQQLSEVNGDFIPAHVSGHIYVQDIIDFITAVCPQTVIPIHTFEPEEYKQHFSNVRVLQDGETFEIVESIERVS